MSATARIVGWQRTAAVELTAGATRAIVVPELGMWIASFTVDGEEYVARPGGVAALRGGHTAGVPLLYPWANRLGRRSYRAAGRAVSLRGVDLHTDGRGLPIHGTMVGRDGWTIHALGRGAVDARFAFGSDPLDAAAFPFPHTLGVRVRVAPRRLQVVTTVQADAGVRVPVSFGWHPYWRVPGARDDWSVALPVVAHERLDARGIPTGRARVLEAAVHPLAGSDRDDLYAFAGAREVELRGRGRRLRLSLDERYPFLQVFAPAGRSFCAIEPMTAPTNALVTGDHPTVRPGAAFAATFTATVHPWRG